LHLPTAGRDWKKPEYFERNIQFEICNLKFEMERRMEAAQEKVERAPVSQTVGFEPEILAFCCEH
jgi:hypothetical protein